MKIKDDLKERLKSSGQEKWINHELSGLNLDLFVKKMNFRKR